MQVIRNIPGFKITKKLPLNSIPKFDKYFLQEIEFTHSSTTPVLKISNAFINHAGFVFNPLRPVKVFSNQMGQNKINLFRATLSQIKKILTRKITKKSGTHVVIHNNYTENYYHFTLEILPKLFILKDFIHSSKIILPKPVKQFQLEFLEAFSELNFEIVEINPEFNIKTETLYCMGSLCPYSNHNPSILLQFSRYIKEKLKQKIYSSKEENKRIYISRSDAKYRRILNEEVVVSYLVSKGFSCIQLETYSVAKQIKIFSNAEIVIGAHGAALTNIIFCKPETKVIELFNTDYIHLCYFNLKDIFSLQYYYLVGDAVYNDGQEYWSSDIVLNINDIKNLVDKYLLP